MASQLTTNIIKIGEPVDILYGRLKMCIRDSRKAGRGI